jgi:hypothetical protein
MCMPLDKLIDSICYCFYTHLIVQGVVIGRDIKLFCSEEEEMKLYSTLSSSNRGFWIVQDYVVGTHI